VDEIIFNFNFQVSENLAGLKQFEDKYKIKMTYAKEEEAVGTAGPLKFAEKTIKNNNKEGFILVFNSDIICDYPLQKLIEFHKAHGKEGTIVLATVEDPSRFGVVLMETDGRINKFIEKPKDFVSNKINAGIYILNTPVIDRIP
jgi:mannose-1-phosphate guanylyltransferase